MAMMFQREVADRLTARVGTPAYGGITLMVQLDWEVTVAFEVPSNAFYPKPKVESAFVVLRPLPAPRVNVGDWSIFVRLVRGAFGQRRKTLRNALKPLSGGDPQWSTSFLERAGIDCTRRGETLTLEEFARLSRLAQADLSAEDTSAFATY
jgi:16S rRNA (adenine1518-N6/adenine1519-N6)-dimethyltransferase